ncbi:MAG: YkgJ family cysteine cluster protein [Desulfobacteraceae bacterium]|jgi:Fe-S-cluster containining protein|nr:YkgJ family cysteine cluster protein [Desulfobacteraceae bacterium]
MEDPNKQAEIPPVRLGFDSTFKFRCHPGVSCFTQCCRGINIVLTPYDIIGLKNRLGMRSEDFLAVYTEPQLLEKTGLPMVTLKLLDDERKSCPFVRDGEGCILYEDRPTSCRYYPLGVAALQHKEGSDDEGFFFFVHEEHCRGFEEDKIWKVREWREDQGVEVRDRVNAEWTDLIVRKRSFPASIQLTEQARQMFFMVSYNIDRFREFVFESTFLQRYPVEKEMQERIRNDETALLEFGLSWLKSVLFRRKDDVRDAVQGGAGDDSGPE